MTATLDSNEDTIMARENMAIQAIIVVPTIHGLRDIRLSSCGGKVVCIYSRQANGMERTLYCGAPMYIRPRGMALVALARYMWPYG